jgi:hypothetical protein
MRRTRVELVLAASAAVLVLGMLISGCCCQGEPVPEGMKDYVGNWEGTGMSLTITADGGLAYKRVSGSGTTSVNAPITRWGDDEIEAGVAFMTTTFMIDKPPKKKKGKWTMTVDGVKLTRQ